MLGLRRPAPPLERANDGRHPPSPGHLFRRPPVALPLRPRKLGDGREHFGHRAAGAAFPHREETHNVSAHDVRIGQCPVIGPRQARAWNHDGCDLPELAADHAFCCHRHRHHRRVAAAAGLACAGACVLPGQRQARPVSSRAARPGGRPSLATPTVGPPERPTLSGSRHQLLDDVVQLGAGRAGRRRRHHTDRKLVFAVG